MLLKSVNCLRNEFGDHLNRVRKEFSVESNGFDELGAEKVLNEVHIKILVI